MLICFISFNRYAHKLKGTFGRFLFGKLLALACSLTDNVAVKVNLHLKALIVIRTAFPHKYICNMLITVFL